MLDTVLKVNLHIGVDKEVITPVKGIILKN